MNRPTAIIFRFLLACIFSIMVFLSVPDSNRYDDYISPPEYDIAIQLPDTTVFRSVWCHKSEDSVVTSTSITIGDLDFNDLVIYLNLGNRSRNIIAFLNYDIISNPVIELDSIKAICYFRFKENDIYRYTYTRQGDSLRFCPELSVKVDRIWTVDIDSLAKKIITSPRISHVQLMSESCIMMEEGWIMV